MRWLYTQVHGFKKNKSKEDVTRKVTQVIQLLILKLVGCSLYLLLFLECLVTFFPPLKSLNSFTVLSNWFSCQLWEIFLSSFLVIPSISFICGEKRDGELLNVLAKVSWTGKGFL